MSPDAEEYHATMIPEKLDEVISERIRQAKQHVNDLREKILEEERNTPPPFPSLSRRDWFAGMAMQGFLNGADPHMSEISIVSFAMKIADAMLAELDMEEK